ncbi:MAG: hypothetical protein ACP5HU_11500, partial [Phycisphaerae bacterium]
MNHLFQDKIFTPAVLKKLEEQAARYPEVLNRLEVLRASGPAPSDRRKAKIVSALRAQRAAWEAYMQAAFICGFFEHADGTDLRNRLTAPDDANFRSAIAECMTCWYFAANRRWKVLRAGKGRGLSSTDMTVIPPNHDSISVEVKAPRRDLPSGVYVWCGDDGDLIEQCLSQANKQFAL